MKTEVLIKTRIKLRTILQVYPHAHVFPASKSRPFWSIFTENTSCGHLIAYGKDLFKTVDKAFYEVAAYKKA